MDTATLESSIDFCALLWSFIDTMCYFHMWIESHPGEDIPAHVDVAEKLKKLRPHEQHQLCGIWTEVVTILNHWCMHEAQRTTNCTDACSKKAHTTNTAAVFVQWGDATLCLYWAEEGRLALVLFDWLIITNGTNEKLFSSEAWFNPAFSTATDKPCHERSTQVTCSCFFNPADVTIIQHTNTVLPR